MQPETAKYDFLIVGAGLFGATFARIATDNGYRCVVVERRDVPGGNIRCEEIAGINVHRYGAHIFHTSDERVWALVNRYPRKGRAEETGTDNQKIIFLGLGLHGALLFKESVFHHRNPVLDLQFDLASEAAFAPAAVDHVHSECFVAPP